MLLIIVTFFPSYTKPLSNPNEHLTFEITSPHNARVMVIRHMHHLGNGLYLWRYRVNKEVQELTITMKYKGQHLGESPYHLGDVLPEKCACPSRSLDTWLSDNNCHAHYNQIEQDLEPYRQKGIQLEGLYERLLKDFPRSHGVHYSIVDNKVNLTISWRQCVHL